MTASVMPSVVPAPITYGDRRFQPVRADGDAATEARSVGLYHQSGELVWAEFSGPTVHIGRLVGTSGPDGLINAAYCMVTTDGLTAAGVCTSTPSVLADGRVRLTERWRRMDGSTGVSYLEEIIE